MHSQDYLDELAARTSLDCGGYAWDNPEPGSELDKLGAVTTDGDYEYFIGGDAIPRKHADVCMGFLAFVENDGHSPSVEFPETLPCDDEGIYARLCTGQEYAVDRDCDWCGSGTGNEECRPGCCHQPHYGQTARETEHCRLACTRCEGTGYQDCPGGDWAWYGYVETQDGEED